MKNDATQNNNEDKLFSLLHEYKLFPQRLLIITNTNKIIYSYSNKNFKKLGYGVAHFNFFKSSEHFHDRGKILDDILKLEFLLAQIIFIKLANNSVDFFDYTEIGKWNKFLDDITFNKKAEFLLNFNLINKKDYKILDKIRRLRNQAAHSFNDGYLEYDESMGDEKKQFKQFRNDMEYIWDILSKIYHNIWSVDEMFHHTITLIENKYAK